MGTEPILLHCHDVSKVYEIGESAVAAVNHLSFAVREKERVALIGRSGSGKSTLLHLLSGMDTATSGEIRVDGQNLGELSRAQLAQYRLKSIGVIFQSFQLITQRTAYENVELPLVLAAKAPALRSEIVKASLTAVGLEKRMSHKPSQLSGGEQQRVAIARALINDPRILFADEPTGNLDSRTAEQILELLQKIAHERSLTMLLITHDQSLAERFASRTMRLVDGSIEFDSSADAKSANAS